MRCFRPLAAAALGAAALASQPALAAPCAGFNDVDTASAFCPSVEWIRNRQITLGCSGTTLYCPNDPVTRLTMAAFLRRLGDALTPVDVTPAAVGPTPGTFPAGNPVLCATGDFTAANFPRRAFVNAAATLSAPTQGIDVRARLVYSTNGGGNWSNVSNSDQSATLYAGLAPADSVTLQPFGSLDLAVGQTVRFGVQLSQNGGGGTLTAACTTAVQVWNRNAASSPL